MDFQISQVSTNDNSSYTSDSECNEDEYRRIRATENLERVLALSSFSLNQSVEKYNTRHTLPKREKTPLRNIKRAFCFGVSNQRLFRGRMIERCILLVLLVGLIHIWLTTREATSAVTRVQVNGHFNIGVQFPNPQGPPGGGSIEGKVNDPKTDVLIEKIATQSPDMSGGKKTYQYSPLQWLTDLEVKEEGLSEEVTLVTAYINIGSFLNDDQRVTYLPEMYHKWMTVFSRIENPVVAYMNNDEDIEIFKRIRANISSAPTKIIKVSNDTMWAFALKKDIKKVFDDPKYPKHSPNTYVADYSCIMHAKYELTAKTIASNPFKSKYMAWIDIGYFRQISDEVNGTNFLIHVPPKFDENRVSYGEVFHFLSHGEDEIFKKNRVWITGSFFISKVSTLKMWVLEYVWYTEQYLQRGLMSTDQQVLYAMYFHRGELGVDIQTYTLKGSYDPWFQLGYVCRDEGEKLKRKRQGLPALEEVIDLDSEKERQKLIDI